MFLLAYILIFTNIAFILKTIIESCRVTEGNYLNILEVLKDENNEENNELLRDCILKKRKRAESVSPISSRPMTPTIPEEDHDQETAFYETF